MLGLLRLLIFAGYSAYILNDRRGRNGNLAWNSRPPHPPPDICVEHPPNIPNFDISYLALRLAKRQSTSLLVDEFTDRAFPPPPTSTVKIWIPPTKTRPTDWLSPTPVSLGLPVISLYVFSSAFVSLLAGIMIHSRTQPASTCAALTPAGVLILLYWWLANRAAMPNRHPWISFTRFLWELPPIALVRCFAACLIQNKARLIFLSFDIAQVLSGAGLFFSDTALPSFLTTIFTSTVRNFLHGSSDAEELLGFFTKNTVILLVLFTFGSGGCLLSLLGLRYLLRSRVAQLVFQFSILISSAFYNRASLVLLGAVKIPVRIVALLVWFIQFSAMALTVPVDFVAQQIASMAISISIRLYPYRFVFLSFCFFSPAAGLAICIVLSENRRIHRDIALHHPDPLAVALFPFLKILLRYIIDRLLRNQILMSVCPHLHSFVSGLLIVGRLGIKLAYCAVSIPWHLVSSVCSTRHGHKPRFLYWIASFYSIYQYLRASKAVIFLLHSLAWICAQLLAITTRYSSEFYKSWALPTLTRARSSLSAGIDICWRYLLSFHSFRPRNSPEAETGPLDASTSTSDAAALLEPPVHLSTPVAPLYPYPRPPQPIIEEDIQYHDLHRPWTQVQESCILSSDIEILGRGFNFCPGILGRGGFGNVYKALLSTRRHPMKFLALKVIRKVEADKCYYRDMTLAEAEFLTCVQGLSCFPKFHGMYENHVSYGLLCDAYLEGSLGNLLNKKRTLAPEFVQSFAADILLGLHHLHCLRIVHRDIKPENILIHQGKPIITDFGLSYIFGETNDPYWRALEETAGYDWPLLSATPQNPHTIRGAAGTKEYMAPEVRIPYLHYSYGADFFSLFVMVHEMLVGSRPLPNDLNQIVPVSTMLSTVLPVEADLLQKALSYRAEERPTLSATMSHPFFSDINWEERQHSLTR